jgi:DNA-binding ferritin-like protein
METSAARQAIRLLHHMSDETTQPIVTVRDTLTERIRAAGHIPLVDQESLRLS